MERQTLLMGVALFVLMTLTGFYAAFLTNPNAGQTVNSDFTEELNVTANDGNDIATVSFDNKSFDMFHENRDEAKFYFDLDRDGSADMNIDGLTHDGGVHNMTEIVTLGSDNYRLYIRYSDDGEKRRDAWMRIYQVKEVG